MILIDPTTVRRLLSATGLLLGTTFWAAPAIAQAGGSDLTFAMKTTTGPPGSSTSVIERFLISGSRIRTEIAEDPPNSGMVGMFTVINSADSTLMSVTPQAHMVLIAKMPPHMGAELKMPTMTVSDITKDSIQDLGPGERLLGYETHHYRITRAGTLTTTTSGHPCSHKFDSIEEVWIAADPAPGAALRAAERRMATVFGGSRSDGESWIDVFKSVAPQRAPRGLALKSMRMTKPDTTTYVMEYTEFSTAPIDSSMFTAPPGLLVEDMRGMNMPDMSGAMAGAMERATAADSASGCHGG